MLTINDFSIDYKFLADYKLQGLTNVVCTLNDNDVTMQQLHSKSLPNPPLENYSLYDLIISVVGVGCHLSLDLLISRINTVKTLGENHV